MDIRLPNGHVISNVPESATKYDILTKALQSGIIKPEDIGQESYSAADDTSAAEAVVIGAGRTADKLWTGTRKLWNEFTGDDEDLAKIAQQQQSRDKAYAGLVEKHPVATFGGEMLPYALAPIGLGTGAAIKGTQAAARGAKALGARNVAAGLLKGGRALRHKTMADAAITGGLLGGAYYGDNQGMQAATGAAGGILGDVAGRVVGRALKPVQSAITGRVEELASWAKAKGIRMTPAQKTGSKPLEVTEASASRMGSTAGPFAAVANQNQQKFNQIALDAVGEAGDKISDQTLGKIHDRLGESFKELTDNAEIDIDDILEVIDDKLLAMDFEGVEDIAGADEWVEKILRKLKDGDVITGKDYQGLQSRLNSQDSAIFKSKTGDNELAFALVAMKDALDEAAERSLGSAKRKAFQKVRRQWKNKIALESPGVINGQGDVSAATLHNVLKRMDRRGYLRGGDTSDFYEMARFGQAFKPMQSSGTAEGMFLQNLLTQGALLGGAGGVAGGVSGGDLQSAASGLGTGLMAAGLLHGGANALTRGYLRGGGYPLTGAIPGLSKLLTPRNLEVLRTGTGRAGTNYLLGDTAQ